MAITNPPDIDDKKIPEPVPDYRRQDDAEFNESMQEFVFSMNPYHAGMLMMSEWMKRTGDEVLNLAAGADLSAQDAAGFAAQARAIAAYKGMFSSLSGTLAIPASAATVSSTGVTTIWMLLQTTANIQNHVPGESSVWYNLTIESGVQLVSSPTDNRADRAVNPTWDFFGNVSRSSSTDSRSNPSVGINDLGYGQKHLVIPGVNPGSYPDGATASWCTWVDRTSSNFGIQWIFSVSSSNLGERAFFRLVPLSMFGEEWTPLGGGGGGSSADGPIKTLVQNVSASNQDGSGNIPVTINCAEHSSFVVNAQNSPFPSAAGAYNITISNLPAAAEGLFIGRIRARNLGRKAVNFILPAGLTASWLSLPQFATANTTAATTWDWIEFFRSPDSPNVIYFDQVNGR